MPIGVAFAATSGSAMILELTRRVAGLALVVITGVLLVYTVTAIIPAILYFVSIYFMVDFEAAKLGMRGMREDELPKFREMARKVFLFLPIVILIAALFMGYSVIRAGTLATVAIYLIQRVFQPKPDAAIPVRGAD